jgi:hypothetical protein
MVRFPYPIIGNDIEILALDSQYLGQMKLY